MKKLLLLLPLLALAASAEAQSFMVGLKMGLSTSQLEGDEGSIQYSANSTERYTPGGDMVGLHIGAFGRVQLPVLGIYVQPELLYNRTGGEIRRESLDRNGEVESEVTSDLIYNRLDMPVMVGFKVGSTFRVNAGPVATLMLAEDFDIAGVDVRTNELTLGYQAGIGFDFGDSFVVDLKYEDNLSNFGDGVDAQGQEVDFDTRNTQIILSVGINFLK